MKRFLKIFGLSLILGMTSVHVTEAQVRVSINIDIQPAWGPAGYDYAEYYYIPEIDIYYDVINRLYWYYDMDRWLSCVFLPHIYAHYDFYSLYKVVLNGVFNPWRYHSRYRNLYAQYRYNYRQVPIYCMHDSRYHIARNNYRGWVEARYMPANEGRPRSRDFANNPHEARIRNDNGRDYTSERYEAPSRNTRENAAPSRDARENAAPSRNSRENAAPSRNTRENAAPSRNENNGNNRQTTTASRDNKAPSTSPSNSSSRERSASATSSRTSSSTRASSSAPARTTSSSSRSATTATRSASTSSSSSKPTASTATRSSRSASKR